MYKNLPTLATRLTNYKKSSLLHFDTLIQIDYKHTYLTFTIYLMKALIPYSNKIKIKYYITQFIQYINYMYFSSLIYVSVRMSG